MNSDANEDCCRECQFAAASVVCRPGNGPCDPQEKCPGNGSTCPVDIVAKDGNLIPLPPIGDEY